MFLLGAQSTKDYTRHDLHVKKAIVHLPMKLKGNIRNAHSLIR